jgi:hypothetical protein
MPSVGFEPMIPASNQAKVVHALDRSATVTGSAQYTLLILYCSILLHITSYSTNVTGSTSYEQRVLLKLTSKFLTYIQFVF